jgi:alkanesulfonate monooxygenase SsuD/methylene tetrahydromethanopterin reductase-like flavin-dependent oxidoreductase (luciferase family)
VVTGYLNSAAKGIGLARQPEHDTRYEIAEEYMQIVYKLWEGSWEDGAVLRDRTQRVFARPEKVHRIRHDGRYFQIEATHLCEPSPQRTPLIYQAGASSRGRQFAAMHAECVFINGPSKQVIAPIVADIRRRAAAAGRNHEPNPSRLAAILAADVVGYSRLMGADEEGTLETSQSAAP